MHKDVCTEPVSSISALFGSTVEWWMEMFSNAEEKLDSHIKSKTFNCLRHSDTFQHDKTLFDFICKRVDFSPIRESFDATILAWREFLEIEDMAKEMKKKNQVWFE